MSPNLRAALLGAGAWVLGSLSWLALGLRPDKPPRSDV
jgi:hypothetical protein